jgi:uncharacterized protein (DUF488 family)
MMFSIGYAGMATNQELVEVMNAYQIECVVDVRSRPTSRNAAFRGPALQKALEANNISYWWAGERLGGLKPIEESAIRDLADWEHGRRACLLCLEKNPRDCHRFNEISRRIKEYGLTVEHIVDGAIVSP